jgi:hypothetical protein
MKLKMQRRGSNSVRKNRHPPCEVLFLCSLRILAFNREKTEMPVCRSLLELRAYGPAPYADGETDEVDASALPLDPIEVAGQMRIAELWSAVQAAIACGLVCLLFAEEAFRFVLDGDFFERQVKRYPDTVTRTHTETARKWKRHLGQMVVFGVLTAIAYSEVRFAASYFAVPKSTEVARTIFNGRALSARMTPPPPCNLPLLQDVLLRLSGVSCAVTGERSLRC